jgi:hypothetical protein
VNTALLVPETVVREDGSSPVLDLGPMHGRPLALTLGITRVIEQQSLEVSVWGSADKSGWGTRPLACFPHRFYCGLYTMALDMQQHPDVRFLKAQWKVNRWGRGDASPLFEISMILEDAQETEASGQSASAQSAATGD